MLDRQVAIDAGFDPGCAVHENVGFQGMARTRGWHVSEGCVALYAFADALRTPEQERELTLGKSVFGIATYAAALTASDLVDGVPIRVVDCGTATMAQGFAAMEAARSAAAGADLDQVAARATEIAGRTHLLAAIGTLEYLHLGGRIGGAARLVGTVLRIKPVLYLANGRVEVFAQPRTLRRAKETMLRRVSELAGLNPVHMAIFHSDALGEALDLRKQATARFECAEMYITELTPVMGAHTGAGVLGVAFYAERGASDAR